MGLISANAVKSVVNRVLKDTSITVAVTYKSLASVFDPTTRETTETITSISCRALKSEYSSDEINKSGGRIQSSDLKFLIRADALSAITPKVSDRIYWNSRDWEILGEPKQAIKTISIGSTNIMFQFHCR
ncbi:MAG TPA: hypothetical protein VMV77_04340 [Bacteroidales bacterium]|nr:hypothetical protein [Bacteroidales bacterium]